MIQREANIRRKFYSGRLRLMSLAAIWIIGFCAAAFSEQYKQIVVATGSPYELGLIDALAKSFESKHGGAVRCVKTPTGPGLDLARNGLVHLTIGHEKEATASLVSEGHVAKRADLMHNYTIVVGPAADPAGIAGLSDLTEVHKRIFHAGSPYLSRGDGGGMDILERKIWEALRLDPQKASWYEVSRQFMVSSLLHADQHGQYHMLDSSTWTLHKAKTPNLKRLVQGPPNQYEICLISAARHPNLQYNQALAEKFFEFMIGADARRIIAEFGIREYGEPVYFSSKKD